MTIYWSLLVFPLVGLVWVRRTPAALNRLFFVLVWIVFTSAIGMRHEVGGDWDSYLRHFESRDYSSFGSVLSGKDPGYSFLNWLLSDFVGGIYWVNTICGMILMTGIVRFSKSGPLPWLALLVATPYLIIVVGMGYTRQSAALGFLLIGLVSLENANVRSFFFWTVLGATFHKSAVLMLPIAALASTSNRFWSFAWGGVITLVAAYLFVFDSAEALWTNYVEAEYHSQGGLIRVVMNVVPAVLFLFFKNRMNLNVAQIKLWFWMSVLAMICVPLVLLSSTATDRVALYLIPIQLFVFAHLPFVAKEPRWRAVIVTAIVAYYALVQFVWLFFASHSYAWLPYQAFWLN